MSAWAFFKIVLMVQVFYALAITGIVNTIPTENLTITTEYQAIAVDLNKTAGATQTTLEKQRTIPYISDIGGLVWHTGSILIDFLLNFITAIPLLFTMLVGTLFKLFPTINHNIVVMFQMFVGIVVGIAYTFGIINLITSLTAGKSLE